MQGNIFKKFILCIQEFFNYPQPLGHVIDQLLDLNLRMMLPNSIIFHN